MRNAFAHAKYEDAERLDCSQGEQITILRFLLKKKSNVPV